MNRETSDKQYLGILELSKSRVRCDNCGHPAWMHRETMGCRWCSSEEICVCMGFVHKRRGKA